MLSEDCVSEATAVLLTGNTLQQMTFKHTVCYMLLLSKANVEWTAYLQSAGQQECVYSVC